ncbi:MAG: hypothetical protein M0Q51_13095 [Bacteroidales bacterium]|nr:hypothetical protein [Bacteroidales bacterium]
MKSHVLIGIYLLITLVVLCLVPVIVFYSKLENNIVRTVFYVGASGGIGGSLYSIRGFYQNLGGETFKVSWIPCQIAFFQKKTRQPSKSY